MASETSDRGETRLDAESGAHDHAQDMFFASAHHDHSGDDVFSAGQPMDAQNQPVQQVPIPANDHVIRVQVTPGEVLELAAPFTPGADLAAREANGNLAIKVGDVTVILEGFINANTTAPVVVETSDGKPIDIATVIAQTDPTIDIQTAAGPAAGPQGQGADNTGAILALLQGGAGLGGFNAVGAQDGTSLSYSLIDNSIIQDRFLTAGPLGGPGFSITGTMSEPVLRDPIHVFAGESFNDFLNDYKSALGGGSGYADFNGSKVSPTTPVDDYLAETTEHIQIPNPTNTGVTFNAADFFSGLSVPTSNGEALDVLTSDNGQTAYLVRPSDGAVIMVFHIDNDGSTGGTIQIESILLNRIDHPGTSDPSHPGSDSYADTLSIDFNTSVPNPDQPQEGSETPPTVPGPGGHVDILDDVPVAHDVHYTSFFGDDNFAPGEGGGLSAALAGGGGNSSHASFTSTDFGSVDEDWLKGDSGQNNQGNQDQDNNPPGSNSDSTHGDDLGRTVVFGNLDIDYGADGPAGAGGNDVLSLSGDPSHDTTLALGLANIPDIGGNFTDANGKQLTSDGHDLVVLDHYVDGKGVEHLIVGYQTDAVPAVDALLATSEGGKDTVKVFELSLDVNPNDNNDKGLDFQDFKFELLHGIDQPNNPNGAEPTESNTALHFDVIGHDDDGDAVHTGINIHVNDDVPVVGVTYYDQLPEDSDALPELSTAAAGYTGAGQIDEDWLNNGNSQGNQDKDGNGYDNSGQHGDEPGHVSLTGQITVKYGGDGPGQTTPVFNLGGSEGSVVQAKDDTGATSNLQTDAGHDVHLHIDTTSEPGHQILVGYANDDDTTAFVDGSSTEVFRLDLDQSTGDFSFTLEDSVKHPIAGTEDNLLLDFGVTAGTDGDGDVAAGSIKINVNDDVPEASVSYLNTFNDGTPCPPDKGDNFGQVDEDMLANGNHDKDDAGYSSNPLIDNDPVRGDDWGGTTVTGTVGKTVDFGADGEGKNGGGAYALAHLTVNSNFLDASGNPVTQDGKNLVVLDSSDTHLSVGVAGGSPAFELTLNPDGTFTFTLEQALDELPGSSTDPVENDLMLSFLAANPNITDGDGDPATALIQIKVNDDAPVAVAVDADVPATGGGAEGNVFDEGAMKGADGAKVTHVDTQFISQDLPDGGESYAGAFGAFFISPSGDWTYSLNPDLGTPKSTDTDTLTYTLTDGDGDTSTQTITIHFTAAAPDLFSLTSIKDHGSSTPGYDVTLAVTHSTVENPNTTTTYHLTDAMGGHVLSGGAGKDLIEVTGSQGSTLYGAGGDDILHATAGHNTLSGGAGDDALFGGSGVDDFYGGSGHDVMSGGAGNDVFHNVDTADLDGTHTLDGTHSIDGGHGFDTVDLGGLQTFDSSQAAHIENVESLDLSGASTLSGGGTKVTLSYDAVYGITEVGGLHVLQISGDAAGSGKDSVHLDATGGHTWQFVETKDGFDTYTAAGTHGVVSVEVEHGVHTDLN
jgi:VCBS repeat-containing protein